MFYERDTSEALGLSRQFIADCYERDLTPQQHYLDADKDSASARQYAALQNGSSTSAISKLFFGIQRVMLGVLGPLSNGMKIGLTHGFDSGASLDYVYRNQEGGRLIIGKFIDRGYLDAIGWRGIRLRKVHMQQALSNLIAQHDGVRPLRILDIAAGSGRYVLETVKRFQDKDIQITLRDFAQHNLDQAKELAGHLQLNATVEYQLRDAFSPASYGQDEAKYDIVIVSGLYELFSENAMVLRSLQGIASQMADGAHLIYTGQPWHPQIDMIAQTLTNHRGTPWLMRPRPQNEMDALVVSVGCQKIASQIGIAGIFTVSVAQKTVTPAAAG